MASVAEILLKIVGKDETSGALQSASKSVEGFGSKLTGLQKGLAVGTTAFAATGGIALKMGSDFDSAYDKIQTGTGATGDKLSGLQDDMKAVFTSVPTSMGNAADAITKLNVATGATGPELQKMAETALNLSRITDTDLGKNIDTVTQLSNNWGLSADQVAGVMDKLFTASQQTGQSVADLAKGVTDNASTFRQMGLGMDQSIALVADLGKAGIDSNSAIAGLTKAVGKFATEGVDAKTGISQTFDAIKNAKSITDATALAVGTFGAKAGPKLAEQIRSGKFNVDELTAAIGASGDSINQTAQDTDDFAEKLTIWKNKAIVAIEPVTSKVFALTNQFVDLGPGILALAPAMGAASKGLGAIGTAATLAKGPLISMGMALLTPPLGIIIALAAVAVAAYVFRDDIIGALRQVWDKVGPILTTIRNGIVGAFASAYNWVRDNWPLIAMVISGPFAPLVALATDAFGIRSALTGAFGAVKTWLTDHWPEIATIISGPFFPLVALATDAFGVRTALGNAWNAMTSAASEAWGAIGAAAKTGANAIIGVVNGIIRAINGVHIPGVHVPDWVWGIGGKGWDGWSPNIPTIPYLAEGGIVTRPTLAMVGESGPEAVVPLSRARGGLAGGLTMIFQGPVTLGSKDERDQIAAVGFAVAAHMRSRGLRI